MSRYKTFVNGGSLLPSDLDAIEDDYEVGFGAYKELRGGSMVLNAPSSGTFILVPGYTGAGQTESSLLGLIWLDPNRYFGIAGTSTVNPRSVYYNLGLSAVTNASAVGTVTFTAGLYAVSSSGTLSGSPVTGSTATISNPAASTLVSCNWSGDFAAPTAGFYVPAIQTSAASASGSEIAVAIDLQMRQV